MGYGVDNLSGLDLFAWYRLMGFNPWHGAQLADPSNTGGLRLTSDCNTLVYERGASNAQRVGRQEIRRAIEDAERQIFQYRHIWPTPRYTERTFPYPQLADQRMGRFADLGSDGRWLPIVLDEGDVQGLGPRTETGATTIAITYTDEDGDGYYETATGTATVPSGTAADEVVVRFVASDCGPVSPRPTIAPRSVSVSGTTATVVLDAWALVRPALTAGWAIYNGTSGLLNATVLPPASGTPFATAVEVLRERADPTGTTAATAAALLVYESRPCPWPGSWCASGVSSDPSATRTVIARAGVRDARAGVVHVGQAVYDAGSGTWSSDGGGVDWCRCYPPDRVILRYQAGTARADGRMRPDLATVVARLAAANLTEDICGCKAAHRELYHWQFDTSRSSGTSETFALLSAAQNPLGPRRGAMYAWGYLTDQQRLTSINVG